MITDYNCENNVSTYMIIHVGKLFLQFRLECRDFKRMCIDLTMMNKIICFCFNSKRAKTTVVIRIENRLDIFEKSYYIICILLDLSVLEKFFKSN